MQIKCDFSIPNYLSSHTELFKKLDIKSIENAIDLIRVTYLRGGKIITCGNGGSAHTASHYITDWSKMVNLKTGNQFKGLSLCDNVGLITAFANDISYGQVFSGQLRSILDKEDLLIAVSGSGNSENVVNAVGYANQVGAKTLAIVGYDGGALIKLAQHSFLVPSFDMQLCEDIHLMFGHMVMKTLCEYSISQ